MSILYQEWKEDLMQAGASTSLAGTVRAIFMDTGASSVVQTDEFFSDITATHGDGGTARGNGATITNKVFANANLNADDTPFTSVNTGGVTCEAIVAYVDSGVDATSHLVAAWDSAGGMPFSTSVGTAITIQWHANGLFDL